MEILNDLAAVIEACMGSEGEIDSVYLLDAVVDDLRALARGEDATAVAALLADPVS